MNITFLVNRDLRACVALNLLRPLFDKHQVRIFLSEKVGVPTSGWTACDSLLQLKHFEQTQFNDVFAKLVEHQPDKANRFLTFDELGELSRGCTVLENINQPEGLEVFRQSAPDLVISIRYGKIIKEPVISIPRLGVLNLHSGLLPKYQGILTTLHSLLAGESEVGCSLHYIDSGDIDTGEIINIARVSVDKQKSLFWHVSQLYPPGCEMILQAVSALETGKSLASQRQDASQQQYFGLPEATHFEQLQKLGFRLWQSEDVQSQYQAFLTKS